MNAPPRHAAAAYLPELEVPVQLLDISRVLRQLGVRFVRASVVEIDSMALQKAWSISENAEVSDTLADGGIASSYPGAASSIGQLADADIEYTLMQKVSPRRWVYAWRRDDRYAVLAEAQYRDRRDGSTEADAALMRMVCNARMRRSGVPGKDSGSHVQAQVWPQHDRRSRTQAPRSAWLAVGLVCAAGLLAGWLALWAAPLTSSTVADRRQQNDALLAATDASMKMRLTAALTTGDYGEAQAELDQFHKAGYFENALVSNSRARVVAMAGNVARQRIGDPVSRDYSQVARTLDLTQGSDRLGQLMLVSAPSSSAPSLLGLSVAAAVVSVSALVTAAVLAMRLRRRAG